MVSFSERLTVAPDVLFRLVGDEGVLLNLNTTLYLGLNPVGTRMWHALTSASSIQAAYDTLLAEYEVEPAQLRADLEEFIQRLLGQKLIVLVEMLDGFERHHRIHGCIVEREAARVALEELEIRLAVSLGGVRDRLS